MQLRIAVAALLCGAACRPPVPAGSLALSPCWLSGREGYEHVQAQCGSLSVFEDRASRTGRTIDLKVADQREL